MAFCIVDLARECFEQKETKQRFKEAPDDACIAEESVYRALVTKYGADVVPQVPVNGTKVVPLTDAQEHMIQFLAPHHPCRPLMTSECGVSVFPTAP
jgi:hypothetical protein